MPHDLCGKFELNLKTDPFKRLIFIRNSRHKHFKILSESESFFFLF